MKSYPPIHPSSSSSASSATIGAASGDFTRVGHTLVVGIIACRSRLWDRRVPGPRRSSRSDQCELVIRVAEIVILIRTRLLGIAQDIAVFQLAVTIEVLVVEPIEVLFLELGRSPAIVEFVFIGGGALRGPTLPIRWLSPVNGTFL